ncbi:MAG: VTT domain-containing protein, partial [Pseudolabrys sp.]|nr:VTT domain-containing protein [Pseudolabrys sp.]
MEGLLTLGIPGFEDLSSLAAAISLVTLPFAHEDLAIILGGYLIVNGRMPWALVGVCLYTGIVVSDFALYALGAGARRIPWLNRLAVDHRVRGFDDVLKRNVFGLVTVCRVVPGIVFVAFVACGWARVSFARFAAASLTVSAFYTPLMLIIVIVFGDALDDKVGLWAWPMLFLAMAATALARKRVFDFSERGVAPQDASAGAPMLAAFEGMPALASNERRVAMAERIPPALFYLPLVFNWI